MIVFMGFSRLFYTMIITIKFIYGQGNHVKIRLAALAARADTFDPKTLKSVNVQRAQPIVCVGAIGANRPNRTNAFITFNNPASCLNSLSKCKGCVFIISHLEANAFLTGTINTRIHLEFKWTENRNDG